ncbi:MAG: exo-alpha-sialidase, partial [Calditrichaeota bacterium]|nr:exo-alpha-sialidase [Calditrichota bacterium]
MKYRYALILSIVLFLFSCQKKQSPIIRHIQIYASHDEYCAWPTVVRAGNGDILVAFSLNEEHLGPDGKIMLVRSTDNGKTWLKPEVLFDTPIDDRDVGLTVGKNGVVLATFWSTFWSCDKYRNLPPNSYPDEMIEKWCQFVNRPEYLAAKDLEGQSGLLSDDNGKSW